MREYFFIHLHGRNPWGGRQRGWHPPEVGDKGVWHASILSQLGALHGARCQCQEQSTCAATVCQLSEGSHQPCELSHHPPVLHLTDPSLLSVGLGSHHWCYQILSFMSLKNHVPYLVFFTWQLFAFINRVRNYSDIETNQISMSSWW